jgi:hypothetical protein
MIPLRWLLVPVVPFAVWYAALALGLVGVGLLDGVCPAEQVVSDHHCIAPWYSTSVEVLIIAMVTLAAFGIVVGPALVAPSHPATVAIAMFAGGAGFATWMASHGGMTGPFLAAITGGIAGTLTILRRAYSERSATIGSTRTAQ